MKDILKAFTSKFRISSEKQKMKEIGNTENDAIIQIERHSNEVVDNFT